LGIVTNPIPELTISLNASHLGERKDLFFDATTFTTSQVYLDAYLLLNLYAEYQLLNKLFTIFVDGRNLTDTVYTEVYGYSTLGFNSKLGFRSIIHSYNRNLENINIFHSAHISSK
jgi:vitamin B12 transporter